MLSDWGAAHIALRVDDIDAAAERLKGLDLVVLEGPVTNGPGPIQASRYLYFRTPWGMAMELEARAGRHPYEAPDRHPNTAAASWDWRPPGEIETEVFRLETLTVQAGRDGLNGALAALTTAARALPGTLDYSWRVSEADPGRWVSIQRFRDRADAEAVDALAERQAVARAAALTSALLSDNFSGVPAS